MAIFILALSIFTFLFWFFAGPDLIAGILRGIPVLSPGLPDPETFPKISVIFSARNEEKRIPEALESMLKLDYPDFEIVAINDRSSDGTLTAMKRFETDPRLKILTIESLPEGWLGKNHALQKGFEGSSGEWIIFTDADVIFHPETLRSFLYFVEIRQLDHIALFPRMSLTGLIEKIFSFCFILGFMIYFRPWKAQNPDAKQHIGIGAFNGIRRSLYEQFGGHAAFKMNVLDDMELGRQVKHAGGNQMAVSGINLISVPWIENGWRGLLRSLEKNGFAGVNYSFAFLAASTVFTVIVNILPFVFLFFAEGTALKLTCLSLGILFGCYAALQRDNPGTLWIYLFHPFGIVVVFFLIWRSAYLTFREGGIRWRDTFYSLDQLKGK